MNVGRLSMAIRIVCIILLLNFIVLDLHEGRELSQVQHRLDEAQKAIQEIRNYCSPLLDRASR